MKVYSTVEQHLYVEDLLEGATADERKVILNATSHLGIIEGRSITVEAIEKYLNDYKTLKEQLGRFSLNEVLAITHYSLDCLNAKCRADGYPEIY